MVTDFASDTVDSQNALPGPTTSVLSDVRRYIDFGIELPTDLEIFQKNWGNSKSLSRRQAVPSTSDPGPFPERGAEGTWYAGPTTVSMIWQTRCAVNSQCMVDSDDCRYRIIPDRLTADPQCGL